MTTQTLNIDTSHSGVNFSVRHMVIAKVRGAFETWQGTVEVDEATLLPTKVTAKIDAKSIDTREPKRDAHLRSADFFDVEKYPELTFESTRVEKGEGDSLRVLGNLTMRGVTREVTLDVEQLGTGVDPWGNTRIGFSGKTSVNRRDFGLNWNQALEAGGVLVGEKVEISLDVQAVRPAVQKAA